MNWTTHRIAWRIAGIFSLSIAFASLVGCGAPKGTVKGKVTFKGNPLPKGTTVLFRHIATDHVVRADIKGDDGGYTCEGVPVGDCQIAVQTPAPPTVGGKGPMDRVGVGVAKGAVFPKIEGGKDLVAPPGMFEPFTKGSDAQKTVPLPPKVREPESSGLTYTVKSGKNEHDIVVPEN
jgi:hypothetical protein